MPQSKWGEALVGELLLGLYTLISDARDRDCTLVKMREVDLELLGRISSALAQQNTALLYIAEFPEANAGIPPIMQVQSMATHARDSLEIVE